MELASESGEEKRRYHSLVRQRQAEETRRRILAAARELFELLCQPGDERTNALRQGGRSR
ncbi:MAG TPA: hypothetical protein VF043_13330 [Ktedonobacteraceae bacterium]